MGSTVQGTMFPANQIGLTIVEQLTPPNVSPEEAVPDHVRSPKRVVLICEVVYTLNCKMQIIIKIK